MIQNIKNTVTWSDFENWYKQNRDYKEYRHRSLNLDL